MEKQEGRDAAAVRFDDPWYDALASGWGELDGTGAPAPVPSPVSYTQHPDHETYIHLGWGGGVCLWG
ncbi:hypothetical protein ACWGH9_15010, partial [Streptomyces chryseus]